MSSPFGSEGSNSLDPFSSRRLIFQTVKEFFTGEIPLFVLKKETKDLINIKYTIVDGLVNFIGKSETRKT